MIRPAHAFACGAALLLALSVAAPARGVVAPDSAERAALESRLGRLSRVQILTADSSFVLPKPAVRSDGIGMREPWRAPRQALIEIDATPPPAPPSLVPWSKIAEIQAPVRDFRGGVTAGAIVGACAVGLTLLALHSAHYSWHDVQPAVWTGAPLVIGVSALAGGVLFGTGETGWRTVYPATRR